MIRHFLWLALPILGLAASPDPVSYVNPLIGTEGKGTEYGGTIPSVGVPFANVYWSPQTRLNGISVAAYNHLDPKLIGFIATRQPAVWMGDYGQFTISPGIGEPEPNPLARARPIRRETEKATPFLYQVATGTSDSDTILSSVSSGQLAAVLSFTFPVGAAPNVVIDASRAYGKAEQAGAEKLGDSGYGLRGGLGRSSQFPADGFVRIEPERRRIIGWNSDRQSRHLGSLALPNFKGWFVIEFSQPFLGFGTYTGSSISGDLVSKAGEKEATADAVGAFVKFASLSTPLIARVGTSLISLNQAEANLKAEVPGWNLDALADSTHSKWNEILGRITVDSPNEDWKKVFYHAMYRVHQFPRKFSESGQYYSAFDDRIHVGDSYNDYSLWDTYRTHFPLTTLTVPERIGPMIQSLLNMYREGGWLPLWPNPSETNIMVGSPAEVVIATASAYGFKDFDVPLAEAAVKHQAFTPPDHDTEYGWPDRGTWHGSPPMEARGGLTNYEALGYVAGDKTMEAVSRTLDFAFADWCSAQFLRSVGDETNAAKLLQRSSNWKNLWDPTWSLADTGLKSTQAVGFFRPRKADGSWMNYQGFLYTETNPIEAFFAVPHDISKLIEIAGGRESFSERLSDFFYVAKRHRHDNEPSHHIPYLWNYAGRPDETQKIVRGVLLDKYRTTPRGYAGNEDCGQMSAWYVMSSLGLYPVNPVSGRFDLGAPLWDKATIRIGPPFKPTEFTIIAHNQGPKNLYVQSVRLNGKPLDRLYVTQDEIVKGGTLEFEMSDKPPGS